MSEQQQPLLEEAVRQGSFFSSGRRVSGINVGRGLQQQPPEAPRLNRPLLAAGVGLTVAGGTLVGVVDELVKQGSTAYAGLLVLGLVLLVLGVVMMGCALKPCYGAQEAAAPPVASSADASLDQSRASHDGDEADVAAAHLQQGRIKPIHVPQGFAGGSLGTRNG